MKPMFTAILALVVVTSLGGAALAQSSSGDAGAGEAAPFEVNQSTAETTAWNELSNRSNATWTLEDASVHEVSNYYKFEFVPTGENLTGEAEVRVDGSSGVAFRVEYELESETGDREWEDEFRTDREDDASESQDGAPDTDTPESRDDDAPDTDTPEAEDDDAPDTDTPEPQDDDASDTDTPESENDDSNGFDWSVFEW